MRKELPVINAAPGICPAARKAARMLHLTLLTFDQAETELYGELQQKGGRMTLAEISRLKNKYLSAIGDALSIGLPVSPLAVRDAVEFGLLEMRSDLKTENIRDNFSRTEDLPKSGANKPISKNAAPFPGFQKY